MKVGTRITAATSIVVAVTLSLYAYVDLRSAASDRRAALGQRARDVALALRGIIELEGTEAALRRSTELSAELSRADLSWRVQVVPLTFAGSDSEDPALHRVRTFGDARLREIREEGENVLLYAVPLRATAPRAPDGYEVVGALEVQIDTAPLDRASRRDLLHTLPLVVVIVVLVVLAVSFLSRSLVTEPIQKLLGGVHDVARGDLSRVLLAEREDEIGALAARFNEMTYSLRESRAETQRQNQARARLEQRLFQTEKLATIGQIAAEIAHEVGTPLNVIAGRARTMAKKSADPLAVGKNATIIAEQAGRITRIIQRLLDFSRRKVGDIESELVSINAVALTTMEFLEGKMIASAISSELVRGDDIPPVRGNADQLQQVLLNLILNAVEAMPEGGALRVETSCAVRRRPGLDLAPQQPIAVIEIADRGPGVPRELRETIFEPFYTSRADQGGTGLGLAVVHGIVKDHDGWLEIDDHAGGGSIFRVYLPTEGAASAA